MSPASIARGRRGFYCKKLIKRPPGEFSSQRERFVEKRIKLRLMLLHLPCGGCGGRFPAGIGQRPFAVQSLQNAFDAWRDKVPGALVLRFFLAPDDLRFGKARQLIDQCETGEWVKLLQPQNLDLRCASSFPCLK